MAQTVARGCEAKHQARKDHAGMIVKRVREAIQEAEHSSSLGQIACAVCWDQYTCVLTQCVFTSFDNAQSHRRQSEGAHRGTVLRKQINESEKERASTVGESRVKRSSGQHSTRAEEAQERKRTKHAGTSTGNKNRETNSPPQASNPRPYHQANKSRARAQEEQAIETNSGPRLTGISHLSDGLPAPARGIALAGARLLDRAVRPVGLSCRDHRCDTWRRG